MKKHYKNIFVLILSVLMFSLLDFSLNAQTKFIAHDFSKFESIDAGNKFDISLIKSDDYSIKAEVDDLIYEYIETYVKDGVLHLGFNIKNLPSNIRKKYRGRNARTPVLKVQVYMSDIQNITLYDEAKLVSNNSYDVDSVTFNLSDNSKISSFDINAAKLNLNLSNNAELNIETKSKIINTDLSGSAVLEMKYNAKEMNFNSSSRSNTNANGFSDNLTVQSSSYSKLILTGETQKLNINGRGSSNIDALGLEAEEAMIKLKNSSTVTEAASKVLNIDLEGRSTLIFANSPKINIINIKSSTVKPYVDSEKDDKD